MRQRNVDDLGPLLLQPLGALAPQSINLSGQAIGAVFLRDAHAQSLDGLAQHRLIVRHGAVHGRGILGIHARHGLEQDGGITHVARNGARLIE